MAIRTALKFFNSYEMKVLFYVAQRNLKKLTKGIIRSCLSFKALSINFLLEYEADCVREFYDAT